MAKQNEENASRSNSSPIMNLASKIRSMAEFSLSSSSSPKSPSNISKLNIKSLKNTFKLDPDLVIADDKNDNDNEDVIENAISKLNIQQKLYNPFYPTAASAAEESELRGGENIPSRAIYSDQGNHVHDSSNNATIIPESKNFNSDNNRSAQTIKSILNVPSLPKERRENISFDDRTNGIRSSNAIAVDNSTLARHVREFARMPTSDATRRKCTMTSVCKFFSLFIQKNIYC